MSCERASNFDQWKTFSENYKPMKLPKANETSENYKPMILACLQIYRELLSLLTFLGVHWNLKKVFYLSWQNTYPNLKTTCHIKLKFLFWTKLLENLLSAKYLKSVAATLNEAKSKYDGYTEKLRVSS